MAKGEVKVVLGMNTAKFERGIKRASRSIKKLAGGVAGITKKAALLGAVGLGAIATGTALAIRQFAMFGDEIDKMSKRTGVAVEALQEYIFAAKLSGTSSSAVEKAIKRMATTIFDLELGLSTAKDAMGALGLTLDDLKGRTPEKQFKTLLLALADVKDESLKSALAQRVFGRAGTQLLPMLTKGAAGLKALLQEVRDLGLVLTSAETKTAAELTDAILRLTASFRNLFMRTILKFAPDVVMWLNRAAFAIGDLVKSEKFKAFQEGFAAVARSAAKIAKATAGAIAGLVGAGGERGREIALEFISTFGNLVIAVFKSAATEAVKILVAAAVGIGELIASGVETIARKKDLREIAQIQAASEERERVRRENPKAGFIRRAIEFDPNRVDRRARELLDLFLEIDSVENLKKFGLTDEGVPKALKKFKKALEDAAGFAESLLPKRGGKLVGGGAGGGAARPQLDPVTGLPTAGMQAAGVLSDRLRRIGGTLGGIGGVADDIQNRQLTWLERIQKTNEKWLSRIAQQNAAIGTGLGQFKGLNPTFVS